jgi:hypothetical protein
MRASLVGRYAVSEGVIGRGDELVKTDAMGV